VADQTLVGRTLPPTAPYLVGRQKVTEFALAIGEGDSVCLDVDAARAAGHPDVVAPPTFTIAFVLPAIETFLRDPEVGGFDHAGRYFDIRGQFTVPRTPQVEPVLLQAGDSEDGRDFGAEYADAIFTLPRTLVDAQIYYQELKGRLARHGRSPNDLLILPGVTFVLGDTTADAQEKAREIRRQQVSGATAIQYLEHVWNRDLSEYDPDGALPEIDPDPGPLTVVQGQTRIVRDPLATARDWRASAAARKLSIREFVIEQSAHQTFIGTAAEVADQIDERVQSDAADGFILVSHLSPTGLDEFADTVVPLLQERGSFRTEYEGTTLRDHLGLPAAGTRRPDPSVSSRFTSAGGSR
jgi:alkanesulfonate monooxygenase SsuD/methylene tetrahydromethanopterin reductase-like flavin-dependent oxidoreductase (luciferase family)